MRKVNLNAMEQEKYNVIKNLFDNETINKRHAAAKLCLSVRQINRLLVIYKTKGEEGFVHGNRNRKPSNTISQDLKDKIISLYKEKYFDSNFTHFVELLKEVENINVSYSFIYNLFRKEHLLSPKVQKQTVKYEKKLIQQALINQEKLSEGQKDLVIINNILDIFDSHSRKARSKYPGEVVEMDASKDYWFGDTKTTLHGVIDDSTGMICGLYFDKEETLNGYFHILEQMWLIFGIPVKILTDNRTVFIYNSLKAKSLDKDTMTQFGYACKTLGITLETTSIPQKKSRIERLWETLQSRLPIELRLANVKTLEEANEFLKSYIAKFNKEFALPFNSTTSAFEKVDTSLINQTLCIISKRKFDNGCCIKYKNNYYLSYINNHQVNYIRGTECLVIETYDHHLLCNVNNVLSELIQLEDHEAYSKELDVNKPKKEKKGKYIPPLTHPWKIELYKKYLSSIKRYGDNANV